MVDCLISFGSNLGDSEKIVSEALQVLRDRLKISASDRVEVKCSEFFKTRPIGGPAGQSPFINGAARFRCQLDAQAILSLLLEIERGFGRERRTRWDSRTLDLDLLLYGDKVIEDSACQIPHPRMSFRRFVLEPACQVAPEMVHPVCGVTLRELLKCVNERKKEILLVSSAERIAALESRLPKSKWRSAVTAIEFGVLNDLFKDGSEYKLLVIDLDGVSWFQFVKQEEPLISRHGGPLHLFQNGSIDRLEIELAAAIETMKANG